MRAGSDWNDIPAQYRIESLDKIFEKVYQDAENLIDLGIEGYIHQSLIEPNIANKALKLARIKHAFRGAALTLLAAKHCCPSQDIRAHKSEQDNGFAARTFDTKSTIPFLINKSLPRSVESHWLTQTLSFAGPLTRTLNLKTKPQNVGPLFIKVVNSANEDETGRTARILLVIMVFALIEIRNREKVVLTRPKYLPIVTVDALLRRHIETKYKTGAPRLPQIAIYAMYSCLISKIERFSNQVLEPLARKKSADRRAGTIGDIVVTDGQKPVEAVEIKFAKSIKSIDVLEAIDKVRAKSVSRYYLLSTVGVDEDQAEEITTKSKDFEKQNGCEIIVNGVFETIRYYLRLLPDTTEFLNTYAEIMERDEDIDYEHRISWNKFCEEI